MIAAAVTLVLAAVPLQAEASAKKADAYLREVKKHLLESYIERERMKEADLETSGLAAMARAAEDPEQVPGLDPEARRALKEAVERASTLGGALAAAAEASPGLDLLKLADPAAQAMVRLTGDPFSRVLTQDDFNKLLRMLQSGARDESPGCSIGLKDGRATVQYVQYGYPAFDEGVEIGDEIVEIRGKAVASLKPADLGELLRLPAGDVLELKIRRDGRDYVFRLAPRAGPFKVVRHQYLGQGVGYLRLAMFDVGAPKQLRAGLEELRRAGMRALLFDLRNNPGGALPAATGIADEFLGQGLTIARTVSNYTPSLGGFKLPFLGGDSDYKTRVRSDFESMPMICLVNGASASASELLAGALKDHRRAVLVGETTYGKGVGQSPIILGSMAFKRYLYLTVMRFTSPSGAAIHHTGVAPDVRSAPPRPSPEKFEAAWELRRSGRLEPVLARQGSPRLRELADYDGFDASRYAGFDAFFEENRGILTRDELREEIRRAARRHVAGDWACDLQTDLVLQRGLVTLLDLLGNAR
jgi:C-terminal peptidase prc